MALYVPVNVVPDASGGGRVAFSARMPYFPNNGSLGSTAQKVRLVWMVQALSDMCKPMPAGVTTTASAVATLRPGMSWSALFPRLHRDEQARWLAFAWLETHDVQVAFHGHTHVQMVYRWERDTHRLHAATQQSRVTLQPGMRYLIGVGSAGAPDDGPHLRYAIYDAQASTVILRHLA